MRGRDGQILQTGSTLGPRPDSLHPMEGSLDEIAPHVSRLWDRALSKSTQSIYDSALASFMCFLAMSYGLSRPMDASQM